MTLILCAAGGADIEYLTTIILFLSNSEGADKDEKEVKEESLIRIIRRIAKNF